VDLAGTVRCGASGSEAEVSLLLHISQSICLKGSCPMYSDAVHFVYCRVVEEGMTRTSKAQTLTEINIEKLEIEDRITNHK
jgi:predicted metal-binding protein